MKNLRLYTSNRLEILAHELADVLAKPLPSPLDEEIIIIQSKGMERWISMQLAHHHGICANCRFPFPNAFIREIFGKVMPGLPGSSPFDPEIMTWKIMKLLPSCISRPGFEDLRIYLRDTRGNLKPLQLSERIGDTFDQYLLFRPEMILQWEKGEGDHWQAELWRELVKGHEKEHRGALGKAFSRALKESSIEIETLPGRVSVFGISALPRFYIQVLAGISRFTEVNLFLMNPCREYWADIVSEWEMKRTTSKQRTRDLTPGELHLEKGNSLLASMGALGRDFFDLVDEFEYEEFASFEDPGEDNLLSIIQSDILNLRDRQQIRDEKRLIADNDVSIRIHSCHSPMREMEILHDQLLNMFENDPGLIPGDILVMTPDIESYSPYIQAVFDLPGDDSKRIPFSIADRSIRKESEIIDSFTAILNLQGSRFGASQVLAILESRAVLRKFALSETDLDLIRRWVKETGIRWGINGSNRSQLGLPSFPENTWEAGLSRLLLGYAMPGEDENMFLGILPYDHMEGSEISVLGRFLEFAGQLFELATSLGQPRTLDEWSSSLIGLLESFFMPDEDTEREMQVLRHTLNDLTDVQKRSGFEEKIDINTIRWRLGHTLKRKGFGYGFISGGVTFCAMLPMRSIPFKIICLVGMNNDAYPSRSQPLGFDLMARYPKKGDRSRRNDDRYLFLETMLSAREKLYISYLGQSIQDNSPVPASVLTSELMDYIEQGFRVRGKKILDHIVIRHRLQAFSPEYFKKSERLFSYSKENFNAAMCLLKTRKPPAPFISRGLSEPDEKWKTIEIEDLCRFFGNPAKFLLNRRLGIYLEERALTLEEREAFDIKGLERYLLGEDLVGRRFSGRKLKDLLPLMRASGRLPHGTVGKCLFEGLSQGVESFVEKTETYMYESALDPLELDLDISGFRLTGRIHDIYPERLVQYRYARIRSSDRLRVWIHHLALNIMRPDDYPRTSMVAGLDTYNRQGPSWIAWEYLPVEKSLKILERLLEKYWAGLIRPLHFFPESSWKYAHEIMEKNRPHEDALDQARNSWMGNDFSRGECEDAYYQLCFGNTDLLDSEFKLISEDVFEPLLGHQEKIEK